MRALSRWLTVFALILAVLGEPTARVAQAATTLFVRANAGPGQNGSSWTDAFNHLEDALAAAASGDQIWVAAGVYTPASTTTGSYRFRTFQLQGGVAVYGGFAGTETQLSQRDWVANVTTLSGDVLGDDGPNFANNSENSYHVVTGASFATLDGFTISGGNANGTSPEDHGGGMYNYLSGNPALTNVTFRGNSASFGGGMANYISSPTLTNVTFSGNSATFGGGLLNAGYSNPTLTNVTFSGNSAGAGGGGMYNVSSSPTLTNVVFSGNSAGGSGGGIYNNLSSSPTLTNVTLSGNSAGSSGGGLYNDTSSPSLVNSVLWGNTGGSGPQILDFASLSTVAFSDVQGGYSGAGNLDADPRFITPITATVAPTTTGNYRLQIGSPAIDAGNTLSVTAGTDRDGNQRVRGLAVDLGAYEALVVTLTVASAGNGSGVVTPTVGMHAYLFSAVVALTATPSLSSTFSGWSGAGCALTNGTVTMNGSVVCIATFVPAEHDLYLPLVKGP